MTKEIYHEGWLIKSPPTKRIWRARWRRRWFTLKQGEIPEQFCLEYYTDRNCRKLKGVIDLDQCEQVDSGLRLEHRNQKFQHMFDVKTPRRTYYLAADSEKDMIDWVNCICQVCNLQDLSKQQGNNDGNRQYYNIGAEAIVNQPIQSSQLLPSSIRSNVQNSITESASTSKNPSNRFSQQNITENNSSVYQNYDPKFRNSGYDNRETMICDVPLSNKQNSSLLSNASGVQRDPKEDYYNFIAMSNEAKKANMFERSQSMRTASNADSSTLNGNENGLPISHGRTQSLVERKSASNAMMTSTSRKIPENLKLNEHFVNDSEPSPALSTSSGPYIAISECISGNPLIDRDNPTTPLNSLDPKFYDTPRSHINIGLNLTNEQPYSPKRNNCSMTQAQPPLSGSPTDSESVFTDDEDWVQTNTTESTPNRHLRPSDSSIENDSIVFTYAQRFSKLPNDENSNGRKIQTKRPKPVSDLLLEEADLEERNKETNSSDTENASPAIAYGPKDNTCFVEENYDIPRSHHLPYYNLQNNNGSTENNENSPTLTVNKEDKLGEGATSTPIKSRSSTLQKNSRHFYTNAAPTKVEGNVFRYDFDDNQSDAPAVDRKLKPKITSEEKDPVQNKPPRPVSTVSTASTSSRFDLQPPCIDRKLKPATPLKLETNSLRRRGNPSNLSFSATTDNEFPTDLKTEQFSKTLPRNYNNPTTTSLSSISSVVANSSSVLSTSALAPFTGKQIGKLEYFDLDHSNPPPICKNANTSASTSNLSNSFGGNHGSSNSNLNPSNRFSGFVSPSLAATYPGNSSGTIGNSAGEAIGGATSSGIVYKSVDFIKTEAFMRTRQDAELNRAKNRLKEQK